MKEYIKLMRPKHYLKNFLVFVPLIFSGQIKEKEKIIICIIGFISFSILSSAIYIINDLRDVEKDKLHPIKKNRPIASGRVSKSCAIVFMIILLIISICLTLILNVYKINNIIFAIFIEFAYLLFNILYSFGLKNIPIIDVVILVLGFIFRLLYGAIITNIVISNWLYLTIMAGAFYMGFGKRRNETIKQGSNSREVLRKYNKDFLDKFMYVCLELSIVFYSLWCIDEETITRIGNNYMIFSIPLLLIILMKYSLDIEGDSFGDPVDVIVNDKVLMALVGLLGIMLYFILYVV